MQNLDDFADLIFLEQPDAGDPSCARFEASAGVFQRDAAQREDGNVLLTDLAQIVEFRGKGVGSVLLFDLLSENGGKDSEIGTPSGSPGNFG